MKNMVMLLLSGGKTLLVKKLFYKVLIKNFGDVIKYVSADYYELQDD